MAPNQETAFEELYVSCCIKMMSYAEVQLYPKLCHYAEDMVQDAFLTLREKIMEETWLPERIGTQGIPYLYCIVRGLCWNFNRRHENSKPSESMNSAESDSLRLLVEEALGSALRPDVALDEKILRELLEKSLAKLDEKKRHLLALHFDGLSNKSIGDAMGMSENNARRGKQRAMEALRNEFLRSLKAMEGGGWLNA